MRLLELETAVKVALRLLDGIGLRDRMVLGAAVTIDTAGCQTAIVQAQAQPAPSASGGDHSDIYHQPITEGNLISNLRTYLPLIGHIHTAGVPSRHELVDNEIDYRAVFKVIDESDYTGYVGLEFRHPCPRRKPWPRRSGLPSRRPKRWA